MKLKELREKQTQLYGEIRKLGDAFNEKKEWRDAEQSKQWETVNKEYDQVRSQIEAEQEKETISQRMKDLEEFQGAARGGVVPGRNNQRSTGESTSPQGDDPITDETRSLAMQGWLLGESRASDLQREAMQRCGMRHGELRLDGAATNVISELQLAGGNVHQQYRLQRMRQEARAIEQRGMTVGTPADGGDLVSSTVLSRLEVNMLFFGPMRRVAETMTTQTGEQLHWPTADDTGNTGAILAEATDAGSEVDPSFDRVSFGAFKFSSKPIKVSQELLEDSTVNVLPHVYGMLGERLGRITNTKYTVGAGTTEPLGIVTAASLGVTATGTTAITTDELIELPHSVDVAYRTGAGFMMHDNTILYIRKLKDNDGNYLWQPGLKDGVPDRLLGYTVEINNDMASSLVADAKSVLFGQLSKYKIRRVRQIRMYRLQELYRMTDEDGFIAFIREDGNLLDAGTAPVKYLKQAAA